MRLLMIMLKTYFKQALALFRQNCLFSTLYIAGTGLAIAMTVVMALVYYVNIPFRLDCRFRLCRSGCIR